MYDTKAMQLEVVVFFRYHCSNDFVPSFEGITCSSAKIQQDYMDIHDFAVWTSCIFVDVVDKGRKQRFVVAQMSS